MNQKLTLSIEREAVERGKRFAQKNGRSLSAIVEDFLFLLDAEDQEGSPFPISPKLGSLVGIGAGPISEGDYRAHRMERHGR